jgi:Rhodopirellula transposase DDE domain
MGQAKTKTGLKVLATVFKQAYQTGRKVTQEFKESMEIVFDTYLLKWNYTAKPKKA